MIFHKLGILFEVTYFRSVPYFRSGWCWSDLIPKWAFFLVTLLRSDLFSKWSISKKYFWGGLFFKCPLFSMWLILKRPYFETIDIEVNYFRNYLFSKWPYCGMNYFWGHQFRCLITQSDLLTPENCALNLFALKFINLKGSGLGWDHLTNGNYSDPFLISVIVISEALFHFGIE